MAVQYNDTEFSETMPFEDAEQLFHDRIENGMPVQALHFGTQKEIEDRKEKARLLSEVADLQRRLDAIESENMKSELIDIPTSEEIKKLSKP